jgi:hypothetical protein
LFLSNNSILHPATGGIPAMPLEHPGARGLAVMSQNAAP